MIPAAGRASRLQPLEGSKELLEVGGRPVLDYLVDRMSAAGAEEIRVVTRPAKRDIVDHAHARGLTVVEAEPETAAASVAAGLEGLEGDDLVLVGFPDTLWEPADGFARLIAVGGELVVGVFPSPEPGRSDVVELEGDFVRAVHVKSPEPHGNVVWGIAVARCSSLDGLAGEPEIGHLFDRLARAGRVRAVVFRGELLDIGTREALERARERYA